MMDEKMDILQYMVENGFDLGVATMDDYCANLTLDEMRALCALYMGEDPAE